MNFAHILIFVSISPRLRCIGVLESTHTEVRYGHMCRCHSIVVVCRKRALFIFACKLACVSKPEKNVNKPNDRWTTRGHLVFLYLIIAHSDVSREHAHNYVYEFTRNYTLVYILAALSSVHDYGYPIHPNAFNEAADRAIINNKRFEISVKNTHS